MELSHSTYPSLFVCIFYNVCPIYAYVHMYVYCIYNMYICSVCAVYVCGYNACMCTHMYQYIICVYECLHAYTVYINI